MDEVLDLRVGIESKDRPVEKIAIARVARSARRHPLVPKPKKLQRPIRAGHPNHLGALRAGDVVVGYVGVEG